MVTFFCPECWQVVKEDTAICPYCGTDIPRLLEQRDYESMLIAALSHREPRTPIRVASILGMLRSRRGVEPLLRLVLGDADIYQKAAAIEALGRIGDARAEPVLKQLVARGPRTLRLACRQALEELHRRINEQVNEADS